MKLDFTRSHPPGAVLLWDTGVEEGWCSEAAPGASFSSKDVLMLPELYGTDQL